VTRSKAPSYARRPTPRVVRSSPRSGPEISEIETALAGHEVRRLAENGPVDYTLAGDRPHGSRMPGCHRRTGEGVGTPAGRDGEFAGLRAV
jgi:hypothetical protein